MKRGISLHDDGVPAQPPKPSHRSADGSDLPARVDAAAVAFREAHGHPPTAVLIGTREVMELMDILRREAPGWTMTTDPWMLPPNLHLAGLRVKVRAQHVSLLEVE